jgi:hypothetical protein
VFPGIFFPSFIFSCFLFFFSFLFSSTVEGVRRSVGEDPHLRPSQTNHGAGVSEASLYQRLDGMMEEEEQKQQQQQRVENLTMHGLVLNGCRQKTKKQQKDWAGRA